MKKKLEYYINEIKKLPLKSSYTREEILTEKFLIEKL